MIFIKKILRKILSILRQIKEIIYKKRNIIKAQKNYKLILDRLKQKARLGEKLDVAFFVVYDSVFPAKSVFEAMLDDEMFSPFIVVIPDILRGKENMSYQLQKTYDSLSQKYKNVYLSLDKNDKFIDFSDRCDIVFTANPYDRMTNYLYSISYCSKNSLIFYINYGYPAVKYAEVVSAIPSLSIMYKIFVESEFIKKLYSKNIPKQNLALVGYAKMDNLAKIKVYPRSRKRVIIAPHHTIEDWAKKSIGLSNFLAYSSFFLSLPEKYPQIDFVFRPHPLLRVTLAKNNLWGGVKTTDYFDNMKSYANVEYQEGGDYFKTFINSDGIIHDCSSFLTEYAFTEKPICYLLRDKESIDKYFLENGKEILSHCYKAFCEKEIIDFIENVILNNNDTMKQPRISFVNAKLKVNYPMVTKKIIEEIKKEF